MRVLYYFNILAAGFGFSKEVNQICVAARGSFTFTFIMLVLRRLKS